VRGAATLGVKVTLGSQAKHTDVELHEGSVTMRRCLAGRGVRDVDVSNM